MARNYNKPLEDYEIEITATGGDWRGPGVPGDATWSAALWPPDEGDPVAQFPGPIGDGHDEDAIRAVVDSWRTMGALMSRQARRVYNFLWVSGDPDRGFP
jgi:hypothetical protein